LKKRGICDRMIAIGKPKVKVHFIIRVKRGDGYNGFRGIGTDGK